MCRKVEVAHSLARNDRSHARRGASPSGESLGRSHQVGWRGTDSSRKHYVADKAARQVVAESYLTLTQLTLKPPYSCQGEEVNPILGPEARNRKPSPLRPKSTWGVKRFPEPLARSGSSTLGNRQHSPRPPFKPHYASNGRQPIVEVDNYMHTWKARWKTISARVCMHVNIMLCTVRNNYCARTHAR